MEAARRESDAPKKGGLACEQVPDYAVQSLRRDPAKCRHQPCELLRRSRFDECKQIGKELDSAIFQRSHRGEKNLTSFRRSERFPNQSESIVTRCRDSVQMGRDPFVDPGKMHQADMRSAHQHATSSTQADCVADMLEDYSRDRSMHGVLRFLVEPAA